MQAALKLRATVLPGHRVEFTAPELPEGADVDVSVVLAGGQLRNDGAARFRELAARWKQETAAISSVTQMALNPAYQEIIGMGEAAIPFLLRELQQAPSHWFWALRAITGEDPVAPEQRGRVCEMADAWVNWGRRNWHLDGPAFDS